MDNGKEEMEEPVEDSGQSMTLELSDELRLFVQQLELGRMMTISKIQKRCDTPHASFVDGKFVMLNTKKQTIFTADWHFIGEYKPELDDSGNLVQLEYWWAHEVRNEESADWDHVKRGIEIVDRLPEGLTALKFPYIQAPDGDILRIVQAYAYHVLDLEYTHAMWSEKLNSYGLFGIYNIEWGDAPEQVNPKLREIIKMVQKEAKRLRKEDPKLTSKDSIKAAWKEPFILGAIAQYKHDKQESQNEMLAFAEEFKAALKNPSLIFDDQSEFNNDMEEVLDDLDEETLAEMTILGDESDE